MVREIFIGPLRHWLLLVGVLGILWWMGTTQLHTHNFKIFLLVLFGIASAIVATVVFGRKKGERITRETLEND